MFWISVLKWAGAQGALEADDKSLTTILCSTWLTDHELISSKILIKTEQRLWLLFWVLINGKLAVGGVFETEDESWTTILAPDWQIMNESRWKFWKIAPCANCLWILAYYIGSWYQT